MQANEHVPASLEEVTSEIATILARGYMRHRKGRRLAPDSDGRAASSRKRSFDPQSARYDFRVFLLHLGLIGDEFKTARKHLIAALPGDSAFKRGRVKPNRDREALAGFPSHTTRHTGPYQGGSVWLNNSVSR